MADEKTTLEIIVKEDPSAARPEPTTAENQERFTPARPQAVIPPEEITGKETPLEVPAPELPQVTRTDIPEPLSGPIQTEDDLREFIARRLMHTADRGPQQFGPSPLVTTTPQIVPRPSPSLSEIPEAVIPKVETVEVPVSELPEAELVEPPAEAELPPILATEVPDSEEKDPGLLARIRESLAQREQDRLLGAGVARTGLEPELVSDIGQGVAGLAGSAGVRGAATQVIGGAGAALLGGSVGGTTGAVGGALTAGAALGPLAVVAGGAVIAIGAMVKAVETVNSGLEEMTANLAEFSPEITAAQAQVEVARLESRLAAADRFGGDLGEFARAGGELEIAFEEFNNELFSTFTPLLTELKDLLAGVLESTTDTIQFLREVWPDQSSLLSLDRAASLLPEQASNLVRILQIVQFFKDKFGGQAAGQGPLDQFRAFIAQQEQQDVADFGIAAPIAPAPFVPQGQQGRGMP